MKQLTVWAPLAKHIAAEVDGETVSLEAVAGGWWKTPQMYPAGTRYSFMLDGGEKTPDPRSLSQPQGVHGPSELVLPQSFAWTDSQWQAPPLASAVLYEAHIGTFSEEGTFDGAIKHLPHLKELGVTHLELLPIVEFPGVRGWGYDGVDLYAPHHAYGGPHGLQRLVDACHREGLAVLLDVVYNHLGPSGNYLERFGPYFTERFHTPWGKAINFDDQYSDEVRRFFIDNALMWLRDYHFDGLRLDAVHAIFDMSATHFLSELASEVAALSANLGRHFVLIAESDLNDPRVITPQEAGGYGIDAQWSDDFHHALHTILTEEREGYYADFGTYRDLEQVLKTGYAYHGQYAPSRKRRHGRRPMEANGSRFVVCTQNHDQIGNRADGTRTSHLLEIDRLKIAAAVLLCSPFVPMLFQGEEWGTRRYFQYFTDHQEPELAEAVRRGRQREFKAFGWKPDQVPDPQAEDTYRRSRLDWTELSLEHHQELLDWYRALIQLRRSEHQLSNPSLATIEVHFDERDKWFCFRRESIAVFFHLGVHTVELPQAGIEELLLTSTDAVCRSGENLTLPPDTVAIARIKPLHRE
ncbi:MAG: malto-oligosyltrehalose trehalohydrolase [Bdellovibrionales bacterium]|nr:malto-oligosyltrehalose trehalohydrolase [Bdellovibrionales bacterium]